MATRLRSPVFCAENTEGLETRCHGNTREVSTTFFLINIFSHSLSQQEYLQSNTQFSVDLLLQIILWRAMELLGNIHSNSAGCEHTLTEVIIGLILELARHPQEKAECILLFLPT